MINLTNNQAIALNRLYDSFKLNRDNTKITVKISINVISLIIRYKTGSRHYWIRKNRIESSNFRFKNQKKSKLYTQKLKKR